VSIRHSIFRRLRFNYYSCSYNFSVDGSFYIGLGDCPEGIADDAINGKYSGSAEVLTGVDAIVYYNPADPSVSSLLEFSDASAVEYQASMPWIGLEVLIIPFFAFGRILASAQRNGKGGVVVDAKGTVIYPEEIGHGSESFRLPNDAATNGVSSPELRELYLGVVNAIHPDRAANEVDLALRERLMKEANAAFERGDAESLRRVLEEYRGSIPAS
jgi:hypothetical protein